MLQLVFNNLMCNMSDLLQLWKMSKACWKRIWALCSCYSNFEGLLKHTDPIFVRSNVISIMLKQTVSLKLFQRGHVFVFIPTYECFSFFQLGVSLFQTCRFRSNFLLLLSVPIALVTTLATRMKMGMPMQGTAQNDAVFLIQSAVYFKLRFLKWKFRKEFCRKLLLGK